MLNRQTTAEVICLLLTTVRLILTSRLSCSCCWCCCCCCCWCCCSSDSRNMDSPASSSNTGSTGSLTSSIRPWKSTPTAVSNMGRARLWTSSRLLEAAAEEQHKRWRQSNVVLSKLIFGTWKSSFHSTHGQPEEPCCRSLPSDIWLVLYCWQY